MELLWFLCLSVCVCEPACSNDSQICKLSMSHKHACILMHKHTPMHIYSLTQQIRLHIPYCHILCLQGDELAVMVHFPQMDF